MIGGKSVPLKVESPKQTPIMHHDLVRRIIDESTVRMKGKQFSLASNQVVYYDPKRNSEFSLYIDEHLEEIKDWFRDFDYEFCYVPQISVLITTEQIQYLFPNWTDGTVQVLDNDFLKPWLSANNSNIGAGFIRLEKGLKKTCRYFPLVSLSKKTMEEQLSQYKTLLTESHNNYCEICGDIRFPILTAKEDDSLYSVFEKELSLADSSFSEEDISVEIKRIVEQLHKEGFEEFVLRCMVPVKEKLSRVVITPKYDVVLPDYGDKLIEMSPLPKAVFFLFLKHPEGLYFKDLVDYKDELRGIYEKITNRTSASVVGDSIDKVTDPTQNAINEKCSRIREAFLKQMDERLAKFYCITGWRSEKKHITLPRHLVEWQCNV